MQKVITQFPQYGALVTPSDGTDLANPGFIRANAAGDVTLTPVGNAVGSNITVTLAAGEFAPCEVKRVLATGTDATPIHVFYAV